MKAVCKRCGEEWDSDFASCPSCNGELKKTGTFFRVQRKGYDIFEHSSIIDDGRIVQRESDGVACCETEEELNEFISTTLAERIKTYNEKLDDYEIISFEGEFIEWLADGLIAKPISLIEELKD